MLKRASKYSLSCSSVENIELISLIFKIIDKNLNTIYFKEFYYVYISKEKHSIEEIAELIGVSETSLKDHIKKINSIVFSILERKDEIKSLFQNKIN